MREKRSLSDHEIDRVVLGLLVDDDAARPWTVEEVAREVGTRLDADDAVDRLYGAGLIHRLGEFVFASRPAVRGALLAP